MLFLFGQSGGGGGSPPAFEFPHFLKTMGDYVDTAPTASWGTLVTIGANDTKGGWANCVAAATVTHNAYGINIIIQSTNTNATNRATLFDIGIDPAGGTSYSVVIPDLVGGNTSNISSGDFITYYFPVYVPAGASVGIRAANNLVTTPQCRVIVSLVGQVDDTSFVKAGTFCTAFGAITSGSTGTEIAASGADVNTAEGAWVELGTLAADHWFWQLGIHVNDDTMAANTLACDLAVGDATTKRSIIKDLIVNMTSSEVVGYSNHRHIPRCYHPAVTGEKVYARVRATSGLAAGASQVTAVAYGVGG